ncbi:MAG: ATP-grasp domain-containing protein [Treponema sp.]|nr:ATP-grasp domain-containing protein [Treponema sp.]
MKKLLLLSCGTNACFHIAKILKEKFNKDFYIVGCDINKRWLIPTCDYLDEFYQSPFSTDDNYYSFVLDICKKEKIDYLLPSFDNDQFLFSCDNHDLKELGVLSLAISSSLDFYRDKECTNKFLESIGIPVPKRFKKDTVEEETEYFVKPVNGGGSIGIQKSTGAEIRKSTDGYKGYVIQELCFEPEYTLECFLYNNKIYSVVRERIASKSGVCTKTRLFQDKELEKYAYKLAENAELPHIFNMQFMKNQKDEYVCTDMNLRTAGGMSLSYAAGWDEVSAFANILLEKDEKTITSSVDKVIPEQYIIRHYEDSVTKIVKKRIAFDLDGTLLDSRKRHEIVMSDVLKKHGLDLDSSGLVTFKSDGHNNIDWLLSKGISEDNAKKINKEWISLIENAEYLQADFLYPNVREVLNNLSKENDLFLVTARNNKENARKQIKRLGIAQYFSSISVVDTCSETSALKAVELTKFNTEYFIGDTESDYKAAQIADCDFYAVGYGFRSKKFLANKNICWFEDLDDFIKQL